MPRLAIRLPMKSIEIPRRRGTRYRESRLPIDSTTARRQPPAHCADDLVPTTDPPNQHPVGQWPAGGGEAHAVQFFFDLPVDSQELSG